ncbi:hypothetical protein [Helicobacter pylori]|uniref:hypothetical protein n=1 Tax=Helicobacter pylori TaxID=210 RepID=UPI000C310DEA|nr:hypothetical protein [Helicobacter pylori]
MTKVDAIKKVMEDNKGIVSWTILYSQIEKYYPSIRVSKEWEAGLRGVLYREIRNHKNFKKVGLSLYALLDYQEEELKEIQENPIRMHSFMEGVCVEIGNFLKLDTYSADPKASYNNVLLSDLTTLRTIPNFTYKEILDTSKKIDVLWFNPKGFIFPKRAIEIVDSISTLEPALQRTLQLLEFNLDFYILLKEKDLQKAFKKLEKEPYKRIKERYKIKSYTAILDIYHNPIAHMHDDFLHVKTFFN